MSLLEKKPYVLYVAEIIYFKICDIKKNNQEISTINAIEIFLGTSQYEEISSGKFHDTWFKKLENNNFIDENSGDKIPIETIKLLKIKRDMMVKQLTEFPKKYYIKSNYPLEISQQVFDHIWRVCESYELWCRETNQEKKIILDFTEKVNG